MIEQTVLDFLKNTLEVPVYPEEPETPQKEYVLIEKTGSGSENYINRATFAIQSFSVSKYQAAELNEKVKKALGKIVELDEICKCRLNSDYDYTDTTRKKYRYQAVFDLVHY